MSNIERWWRVTRPSDGHVTWTDEDPSDRLVAAWEGAKVEGPFVPESPRGAVKDRATLVAWLRWHFDGRNDLPPVTFDAVEAVVNRLLPPKGK